MVLTIIGLKVTVITVQDLGRHSLASAVAGAAGPFLGQQLCDFQPGYCVPVAAVLQLDKSRESIKC